MFFLIFLISRSTNPTVSPPRTLQLIQSSTGTVGRRCGAYNSYVVEDLRHMERVAAGQSHIITWSQTTGMQMKHVHECVAGGGCVCLCLSEMYLCMIIAVAY